MDIAVTATVVAIAVGLVTGIATLVRLRWERSDRQHRESDERLSTFTTRDMYDEIRNMPERERSRYEQRERPPSLSAPSFLRLAFLVATVAVVAWLVYRFVA